MLHSDTVYSEMITVLMLFFICVTQSNSVIVASGTAVNSTVPNTVESSFVVTWDGDSFLLAQSSCCDCMFY